MPVSKVIPWENYSRDGKYLYVRCLDEPVNALFEGISIEQVNSEYWKYHHSFIFLPDWLDTESGMRKLDNAMHATGYEDFEHYVTQGLPDADAGIVRNPDGTIDKAASPGWTVSMIDLAAHLLDHSMGQDSSSVIYAKRPDMEIMANRNLGMSLDEALCE